MKTNNKTLPLLATTVLFLVPLLPAQSEDALEQKVDTLTIPFSGEGDRFLEAHLMNGSITVKGYEGAEAVVEATNAEFYREPEESEDGLRVIRLPATGLYAEEKDNRVKVGSNNVSGRIELNIKVPVETSLKISCLNHGNIVVENVKGELNLENLNGEINATNVSGSVVAHALNRDIVVTFDETTPEVPMSFTSLNGDIDVTLPADTAAELKMESFSGSIKSGFDIDLRSSQRKPEVSNPNDTNGRYRLEFDQAIFGTINGGGPLYTFSTHNGEIRIRKANTE